MPSLPTRRSSAPLPPHAVTFVLLALAACGRAAPGGVVPATAADSAAIAAGTGHLPEVAAVRGPVRLRVVYPQPGDVIDARDSTFVFGSAGAGDAQVTVNGQPARVSPNGAWL